MVERVPVSEILQPLTTVPMVMKRNSIMHLRASDHCLAMLTRQTCQREACGTGRSGPCQASADTLGPQAGHSAASMG